MGSTNTPVLEQTGFIALDKIPPVGHNKSRYNNKHSFHHTKSYIMVRRMRIHNWDIQLQGPCMYLSCPTIIAWHIHAQPNRIISV